MAGHSHWAGIKHKKALIDNKRGKLWSKLSKAIIVAAKIGGGDPDQNLRLRYAIDDAKAGNMPNDTIKRAVKKGTGELAGGNLEEVLYEGYGPGGAAILCEILTDNRNRTAPEVRKIFEMADGNLGATGCVAWMFERKGLILAPTEGIDEESLIEIALEAGADDVAAAGENFEVTCEPSEFEAVKAALKDKGIVTLTAEITRIASNMVDVELSEARKVVKLLERLDDHDDVQSVSTNCNLTDEALAEVGE